MHVLETCCLMEYRGRCLLPYSCTSVRACSRSGKLLEGLRLSALPPMVHEVSPMLLRCLFQQSSQTQCANGATGLYCVTGLMLLCIWIILHFRTTCYGEPCGGDACVYSQMVIFSFPSVPEWVCLLCTACSNDMLVLPLLAALGNVKCPLTEVPLTICDSVQASLAFKFFIYVHHMTLFSDLPQPSCAYPLESVTERLS